jgi:hypothetical protein
VNIIPSVEPGMVILDVIAGRITFVEVLDRSDVRDALHLAVRRDGP